MLSSLHPTSAAIVSFRFAPIFLSEWVLLCCGMLRVSISEDVLFGIPVLARRVSPKLPLLSTASFSPSSSSPVVPVLSLEDSFVSSSVINPTYAFYSHPPC